MNEWHIVLVPFGTELILFRCYQGDDEFTLTRTDIIVPRVLLPQLYALLGALLDESPPKA